jgi:hypothetical protein
MAHIRTAERCIGVAMMVRRTPERDRKYLKTNDNFLAWMISARVRIAIAAAR